MKFSEIDGQGSILDDSGVHEAVIEDLSTEIMLYIKKQSLSRRNPRFIELLPAGYINCGPCFTPAPLTGHILCDRLHFRETVQDKEGFQWIDRLHWCPYFQVTGYKK